MSELEFTTAEEFTKRAREMAIEFSRQDIECIDADTDTDESRSYTSTLTENEWNTLIELIQTEVTRQKKLKKLAINRSVSEVKNENAMERAQNKIDRLEMIEQKLVENAI